MENVKLTFTRRARLIFIHTNRSGADVTVPATANVFCRRLLDKVNPYSLFIW